MLTGGGGSSLQRCRRRFYEIVDDAEREVVAKDIAAWGYYRELVEHELEVSVFVRYGHDCIIWLNEHGESGLNFHIVIEPHSRGSLSSRRLFMGLEVIAELLGAQYLQASLYPGDDVNRNYCARLGWRENDEGYVRFLGDG